MAQRPAGLHTHRFAADICGTPTPVLNTAVNTKLGHDVDLKTQIVCSQGSDGGC